MTPSKTSPSVAVVGGGFGGVGAVVMLKRAGYDNVTVFERSDGVGGVWHHNTYPGAACDVPSHLYEFSFAPNPRWSRRYAPQPEIQAYLVDVARRHGVLDSIRTNTEVTHAQWDEASRKWVLQTSGGTHETDILLTACGQLSTPSVPPIPGLESFEGPAFHTAEWRHDVDLTGKRVAVIGTGCSAIQTVPAIQRADRAATFAFMELGAIAMTKRPGLLKPFRAVAKRQIDKAITDPELRRKVTPTDEVGCKRLMLTDQWYPTLTLPNVELISDRIADVSAGAIRSQSGAERPTDVVVLATGFKTHAFVAPMEIVGTDGHKLADEWADVARAYLGMSVPAFPNMFLIYGPNTNGGTGSVIDTIEAGVSHVIAALKELGRTGSETIEVRREVADRFHQELRTALSTTVWHTGCTSWYVDENGHDPSQWPWTWTNFRRRTAQLEPGAYALSS